MAILAFVQVRGRGELAVMSILVTVRAKREFYFVNRVLSDRQMAFGAFDRDVLAFQGIAGRIVFLHAEQRRLPSIQGMALCALALFRTSFELAFVRIGLVAIHAICEGKRLLEITIDVTGRAANRFVFAKQRIFCVRMIERKGR